uniref:Replication factor A C-terminal domain-containing protein n=1 Tax=Tanacetum cinerariifolium TaxID=118510 RepID=A0A6L2P0X2_TANCI|nr:hypothetical protein [Tanacetum cinerariifolium]
MRDLPAGFRIRAHGDVKGRCGKGFGTVEVYMKSLGMKMNSARSWAGKLVGKSAQNMSSNTEVTYSEGKVHPSDDGSQPRSQKGWNFPGCGGEKCKKGVVRKNGSFWCQACEKAVDYLVLRFRLELDVSDKTASTIVVMFDEPTKELLKCSVDSLVADDDESGFGYADHAGLPLALANIIDTTHTLEMKSHTYYEHGVFESFTEELEDSNEEVTGDMDDGGADDKESSLADKKKKKSTLWMIVTLRKPSEFQATQGAGLTSEINRQAVMD